MKIRSGFVSNSSSSSFILDANKHTCVNIAKKMAKTMYSYDGKPNENERYKKIIKNLNNLKDKNTSIYMDCTDDIRIVKKDDKIYVEGSYHYEWNLDNIKCGEEGAWYDIIQNGKFYFPEIDNKILGKMPDWEQEYPYKGDTYRCECEAGSRFIEIDNGELMCPSCCCDPDGKKIHRLFREDKLKRILNNDICE